MTGAGERSRRAAALAATALVLVGAGSVVKVLHRHPSGAVPPAVSVSSPSAAAAGVAAQARCTRPAPASWRSAIAGREVLMPSGASVVGVGGDATLVSNAVAQAGSGALSIYALGRAAMSTPVWSSMPAGSEPVVDPDAAIEPERIVLGMPSAAAASPGRPGTLRAVVITDRRRAATVVAVPSPRGPELLAVPPILIGDTAYWVQRSSIRGAEQVVAASWPYAPRDRVPLVPRSQDVVRLFAVGGLLAWLERPPGGSGRLVFEQPDLVPIAVEAAAVGGMDFASDRSVLSWRTGDARAVTDWTWSPGWSAPVRHDVALGQPFVVPAGEFLLPAGTGSVGSDGTGAALLVDRRTGAEVVLPVGVRLVTVQSGRAVVTRHWAAAAALAQIPLAELPPVLC